jgi:OHCU decarboxylase
MPGTLERWNRLSADDATAELLSICGAMRWAQGMAQARPLVSAEEIEAAADRIWETMEEPDWLQAIACHPRIGSQKPAHATEQSRHWSQQEQSKAQTADAAVLSALETGNCEYEQRFGITYIVCATGKSAPEMLAILQRRLTSTREAELREAAEQQRQITRIRLRKWLDQ